MRPCVPVMLVVVTVYLRLAVTLGSRQCTSSSSRDVSFALNSRRNVSGYWNTQVRLVQGTDSSSENKETGPVLMQVDQSSHTCDGEETVVVMASLSTPPHRAGPGYELVPGVGRYKLHPTKATWEQARLTCMQEGAHLAIIDSTAEAAVLVQIFTRYKSDVTYVVYLGFHDLYFEGQFLTVLGRSLNSTGYLQWSPSEPSGSRSFNCGCMHPTGLICDVGCTDPLSFFCEQELF